MSLFEPLNDMIYKRKSVRSYTGEPVSNESLAEIENFISTMKPLYEEIQVRAEIVDKNKVKSIFPWMPPQNIAIFTEEKDGAMENVGFLFQQLDLYLQSIGLGSCWVGVSHVNENKVFPQDADTKLKYALTLAFGHAKDFTLRNDVSEFHRKELTEISDQYDERLEPARLAPSSMSSQPWYFVHENEMIHLYCVQKGVAKLKQFNRIDAGIALAHMYVSNPNTFHFLKTAVPARKGYDYIGSFSI